jgi:Na+/H+-dicarboxylate symporter
MSTPASPNTSSPAGPTAAPAAKGTWLLTWLIVIGLVLGAVVGQWLHDTDFDPGVDADSAHAHASALYYFSFVGKTLFMGLLKLLIVPLIVSSVVAGVASVGDFRQLGRLGAKTLVYYFGTMLIAVTMGLVLVNTVRPGDGMNLGSGLDQAAVQADEAAAPEAAGVVESDSARRAFEQRQQRIRSGAERGLGGAVINIVEQIIPPHANILRAAVEGQTLALIAFSIFFGIILTTLGATGRPLVELFNALFHAMMKMVHVVIWLAPIGVFCLLAWTVARIGLRVFTESIGTYMVTVVSGLAVHGIIVLPIILWLFTRTNPFRFLHQMRQALMTAFGTDSSSATLPVTMECATEQGGVSERAAGFVLPLGATINMDGTALYEAVAVAFLFQAYGFQLGVEQSIIIALTATLAAVGAAGIPEAGLVTMVIVIGAVNHSLAGTGKQLPIEAVGIIIGIDRLLDMCRTTVNVWGDAVGSKIISQTEPDRVSEPEVPPTAPASVT